MTLGRRARGGARPLLLAMAACLALCGCGAAGRAGHSSHAGNGAALAADVAGGSQGSRGSAADTSGAGHAREAADPQEAESYPAPVGTHHASATSPAKAASFVAAGAMSDEEVNRALAATQAAQRKERAAEQKTLLTPVSGGQSIGGEGTIPIPGNVPEPVQKVIAGANEIADFPYVFGGGHGSFIDSAYDCSGSVSYALAAAGLISRPEVSGELEHWGAPGPGHYITVYANAGHAYMYVDGILYDTAGRSGVYASRWLVGSTDNAGFVARHWPGL